MYCIKAEPSTVNGVAQDVLTVDHTCSTGYVVTTKEELAKLTYYIQPLTSEQAGQLATSVLAILVTAWALGRFVAFVWSSR
ncbi:hypothetical protein J2W23_000228 [Variovorax boronicumulans]|uniref:hypothetical protein n=1 Tax=Variovorax boronicumulans TaxID=436515 RepID=UPI00278B21E6|nr:hypothetical protein [Variovorax boronicumulans]MDQ0011864.1 hypothetical protein [Variovorax boronicumulans]